MPHGSQNGVQLGAKIDERRSPKTSSMPGGIPRSSQELLVQFWEQSGCFFGNVFAWISILAEAFDGLENLALIQFLLGSELTFWNGMSGWSTLAKFGLMLSVMG